MRKNQIDNLIKSCNEMEQKIIEVKNAFDYLKNFNPRDYSEPDRTQVRESMEYCENDLLMALLEINKRTEDMVKKIDPEAW